MDASPPPPLRQQQRKMIRLPESVEVTIERICIEKKQPPLKEYARKMLGEIGEQASLEVLTKILSTSGSGGIKSFGGFVAYLVKKEYPIQANTVLADYQSPQPEEPSPQTQRMWSPSSHPLNGEHLQSPLSSLSLNSTSSNLQKTSPQSISCQLSFEDETQGRRIPSVHKSSLSGGLRDTTKSMTISRQLMILSKLRFRKLFLLLSYIKRSVLLVILLYLLVYLWDWPDIEIKFLRPKYGINLDRNSVTNQIVGSFFGIQVLVPDLFVIYSLSILIGIQGRPISTIVMFMETEVIISRNAVACEGVNHCGCCAVFKDERKRSKKNQTEEEKKATCSSVKCYFVHIESVAPDGDSENYILSGKRISEARRCFMHIHTVSTIEKYMARLSPV
ncbi:hypothetical protein BUALT_Bualt16G0062900 [Buddleja alternifolia]|uniref:RDRP3-5 N-terminal domain-containing protein n=1 Tax=Buddleja alternifolia TaxID=168488 RepID=A0AAV6W9N9_9LAMI|nr:hypothetical protein BUALT_Bualt16G0062900 [Buddleja alternifolia]